MARSSIRDLRYDFPRVERLLAEGESIEITKHRRVIATLVPVVQESPAPKPDFAGRMEGIFGKKTLKVTGAKLIRWDRDRGT